MAEVANGSTVNGHCFVHDTILYYDNYFTSIPVFTKLAKALSPEGIPRSGHLLRHLR